MTNPFFDLPETRQPRGQQSLNPNSSTLAMRRARCYVVVNSVTLSIPNSTFTPVAFDATTTDSVGLHSDIINNTRITIPSTGKITGLWIFHAHIIWAASAAGNRRIFLRKNGSILYGDSMSPSPGGGGFFSQEVLSYIDDPNAGDYFEIVAVQDSGGALNIMGNAGSYFEAVHLW